MKIGAYRLDIVFNTSPQLHCLINKNLKTPLSHLGLY